MLDCGTCILFQEGHCNKPDDMSCRDAVAITKELGEMLEA